MAYDKKNDVVWICPNNTKGDIITIQNLRIGLPKPPTKKSMLFSNKTKKNQYWRREEINPLCTRDNVDKFEDYIIEEFRRRREGVWFLNKGVPTYITGSHYMYIQWSKIDVGYPEYRDANRRLFLFWEACKVDYRCYGICYLKNRRSGFSYCSASEIINIASSSENSVNGILSKTGKDAQDLFTDKAVYIFRNYPWFFKPIQDGSSNPRMELAFRTPAQKITKKNKYSSVDESLNSIINWRNTQSNSYDGQKLKLLIHDESAKWSKPNSIKKNWRITRTCLLLGRKIVGKCMMGTTANAQEMGGEEYKEIYYNSDITNRDANGQTVSGLYSLFIPAFDNLEGFIDVYGFSIIETPKKPVLGIDDMPIDIGSKEYLSNRRKALSNNNIDLNEFKRQFPFTEEEAFRADASKSTFDVEKIFQQLDYLEDKKELVVTGNFIWKNPSNKKEVIWIPSKNGKFNISLLPEKEEQNNLINKNGVFYPGNARKYVAGCDPFDHDYTVDGRRSNGAVYIYKKFSPFEEFSEVFCLEYINRPPKASIFYEDVLKACVFYGAEILIENNKVGIINYFRDNGFSKYLMERPEYTYSKTSVNKKRTPGIPTASAEVINLMGDLLEAYIHDHVGYNENGDIGKCYFTELLKDWSIFEIDNRTKYDASIASSLALIAATKKYAKIKQQKKFIPFVRSYRQNTIIRNG
tara:strand:+ start:2409 stop:4487 length:2079 start_codon:yes stop_codon:yes gene_type:complete